VVLPEGAAVLGHPAAQALPAALESVTVEQVRRGEALLDLETAGRLEPGDVLLLLGPQREVEAAEAALLAG
jgi:hypothetical protein